MRKLVNLFGSKLTIRVLILLVLCLGLGVIFLNPKWIFMQVVLSSFIVLSVIDLHSFIHRTNQDVAKLLNGLYHEEYGMVWENKLRGAGYRKLRLKLVKIKDHYERIQQQVQFDQALISMILTECRIGFITFDDRGKIYLQSSQANRLLGVDQFRTMSELDIHLPGLQSKLKTLPKNQAFTIDPKDFNFTFDIPLRAHIRKYIYGSRKMNILLLESISTASTEDYDSWFNFAKVLGHEVINGISPIVSIGQMLQEELNSGSSKSVYSKLERGLPTILEQTSYLQNFAESYRQLIQVPPPNKQKIKLDDFFNEIGLRFNAEHSEVNLSFENSKTSPVLADKSQLTQVLVNLLNNAVKASATKINISVGTIGLYHVFRVMDNGKGIDPENYSKIFQPFFTTSLQGSGIGLSLARQIIWKHNGTIHIDNQVKDHTSFVIKIPIN